MNKKPLGLRQTNRETLLVTKGSIFLIWSCVFIAAQSTCNSFEFIFYISRSIEKRTFDWVERMELLINEIGLDGICHGIKEIQQEQSVKFL